MVMTFSSGGQKSAYECFLTQQEHYLLNMLAQQFLEESDSFVLQPIADASDIRTYGIGVKPINRGFIFIG
jgi:CRISPR/Cas system-associated endoribonuclease Cas2